jgi:CO/xanthine dehydrogenase Mo-binding subunit
MRTHQWSSVIGKEVVPLIAPAILNAIQMATGPASFRGFPPYPNTNLIS